MTTSIKPLSPEWWAAFASELNDDARWARNSQWLEARIQFNFGDDSASIDVRDGKVVDHTFGPHPRGADIFISGPVAEWNNLIAGGTDWYRGTSPGLGDLSVQGDVVQALRNMMPMWLTLEAMKRVGVAPVEKPAPSPEPVASGAEIIGRYIDVDGIRTYYETAGDGPKTVVCFHAASQDTMMYRHVLEGLSDEYRVIAIDAPGHAKTLPPADGLFRSLTRHAEFNERFLEILGIEKPAIVGCSMGGNLVLELAARRPDAYSAIVSSEGADYTPTVAQALLDIIEVDGHQVLEGWSQSLTGNRTPDDRAKEIVWQIRRNPPEVMAADLTGYAGFDKRDVVGNIKSPVLLLRGDADWLVYQEQVEATQSRIPGSEIAVLAGTGHYPMTENPQEYNETLRDFFHRNGF